MIYRCDISLNVTQLFNGDYYVIFVTLLTANSTLLCDIRHTFSNYIDESSKNYNFAHQYVNPLDKHLISKARHYKQFNSWYCG